jgi:hypothetical protein
VTAVRIGSACIGDGGGIAAAEVIVRTVLTLVAAIISRAAQHLSHLMTKAAATNRANRIRRNFVRSAAW